MPKLLLQTRDGQSHRSDADFASVAALLATNPTWVAVQAGAHVNLAHVVSIKPET